MGRTLYEKIWDKHTVVEEQNKPSILYIDLHLVHEVTSPQAFEGLRIKNRKVRRPDLTVATMDHSIPTTVRSLPFNDPIAKKQVDALAKTAPSSAYSFLTWKAAIRELYMLLHRSLA